MHNVSYVSSMKSGAISNAYVESDLFTTYSHQNELLENIFLMIMIIQTVMFAQLIMA